MGIESRILLKTVPARRTECIAEPVQHYTYFSNGKSDRIAMTKVERS